MNTSSRLDSNFTQNTIDAIGPNATPRIRKVFGSLIRHLHDFARENEITVDELRTATEFINSAGKTSHEKRNELLLLSQVIGLRALVENMASSKENPLVTGATASTLLGPFYRDDAPVRENESFIFQNADEKDIIYVHGIVSDQRTKKPLAGAWVDVWQANSDGLYDHQDQNQSKNNLRGKFKTDQNGHYGFYSVKPGPYKISFDGPSGDLLKLLDRPFYRPGHIHLIACHEGYISLTTQVYSSKDLYLKSDVVFAVKDSLIVDFKPLEGNPKAKIEVEFPIILAPLESTAK